MKLIFGLGNPEPRYTGTRHNVGCDMVSHYVSAHGLTWQKKPDLKAELAKMVVADDIVLFVKPTTYYNDSGEALRAVAHFYKVLPENVLVLHDDHALPFGVIRTRSGGSDAGNNGIKSINAHLPGTKRLRIGTHSELRATTGDTDYVLSKFSATERQAVALLQQNTNKIVSDFMVGNFIATTFQLDAELPDNQADKDETKH